MKCSIFSGLHNIQARLVKLDEPQPLAMLTLLAVPVQDGKFSLICDPMHMSLSYVNV